MDKADSLFLDLSAMYQPYIILFGLIPGIGWCQGRSLLTLPTCRCVRVNDLRAKRRLSSGHFHWQSVCSRHLLHTCPMEEGYGGLVQAHQELKSTHDGADNNIHVCSSRQPSG